jgi:cytochrome P450
MRGLTSRILGLPHRLVEDDIYEGYLLPKGSIVIANIWYVLRQSRSNHCDDYLTIITARQFLHDPEAYGPNPYDFDPSRFLGETPAPDPRNCCFGFGRR